MRSGLLVRIFFATYCLEAGVFLVLVPWSPGWDRFVYSLPWVQIRPWLLAAIVRAAFSGFGFVHLIWGVHDLDAFFAARRQSDPESS